MAKNATRQHIYYLRQYDKSTVEVKGMVWQLTSTLHFV